LRAQAETARTQTLDQALRMLGNGRSAEDALEFLANTLTNRLLHSPTQALREAAASGDDEIAKTLTRLLTEDKRR
jgi:glutamyl-tRNA reductase